jgi:hypothetical protein
MLESLRRRLARSVALFGVAGVMLLAAAPAGASQNVINVIALTGGSAVVFVAAPATATVTTPLYSGNNPVGSAAFSIEIVVTDLSGTNAGWKLTTTAPDFIGTVLSGNAHLGAITASGAPTLATDITVGGILPISGCVNPLCFAPQSSGITYPVALGTTASKFANSAAGHGQGVVPLTQPFAVVVPTNTTADTYTSTFVMDIASGP